MDGEKMRVLVLLKPGEVQPAMERAAEFARFMPELEVVACRVIHEFDDLTKPSLEQQMSREMLKIAQRYPSIKHFIPKIVFNKNVPEAFVQEAKEGNYLFAIISANKRNTIKDLFISTIDCSIMRLISIPLLVVKDAHAPQRLGRAILLCIDFEADDHEVLADDKLFEAATMFANNFNGEIHVANVVSPLHLGIRTRNTSMSPMFKSHGVTDGRADYHGDLLKEFADKHGIPDERTHVLIGRVDEEIPHLSHDIDARMVCMGMSPNNGLLGAMNSGASELVLEQIKGDLFIVNGIKMMEEE